MTTNNSKSFFEKIWVPIGLSIALIVIIFGLTMEPVSNFLFNGGYETVEITMTNFSFTPDEIEVEPGEKIKLKIKNDVGSHNFVIKDLDVKTNVLKSGQEEVVKIKIPDESGKTIEYRSTFDNQDDMGMIGKIIIE